MLVGIVYVLGVLSGLFGPSRPEGAPSGFPADAPVAPPEPVVAVSPLVAALITLLFTLLSAVVAIGALRILLTDETERLPSEAFTRRFGPALLNLLVGGLVFAVAVAVGFVLLVVPGVFLLVSLVFWAVFVVDEDVNFIEGFRRSWGLTSGHRLRLFLLGLLVILVVLVVNVLFGILGLLLGTVAALLGVLVGQIGGAFVTVFSWATLAAAYDQLDDADAVERSDGEFEFEV